MPAKYEAMRDKFAKMMPMKEAKGKAARIYNAKRKPGQKPVSRFEKIKRGLKKAFPKD